MSTLLRNYELDVWWDYGLEAGSEFEPQIMQKLHDAKVIIVLWCRESVASEWVLTEAREAGDRLLPVRLQDVTPPQPFGRQQSIDLTCWDGSITKPLFQKFVEVLLANLDRENTIKTDSLEELGSLARIEPLPREPLSETGGPEFESWMMKARPILESFQPLYKDLKWQQHEEQKTAGWFVSELGRLIAGLPPLPAPRLRREPSPVHQAQLLEALRQHISAEIHQGHPIPDSYRIEPIVSELCIRPGIIVTCWSRREGFGTLKTGLVVALEFQNPG